MKAVQFLENSKLKNNFMTIFYDAIILCKPNIYFEPYVFFYAFYYINLTLFTCINCIIYFNIYFSHLMVHIGKTYNLWYKVIDQMEDVCSYYEHHKKNVSYFT